MLMMLCAFVYVLNELNFCHVFIRIACVSWVVNDVWEVVINLFKT